MISPTESGSPDAGSSPTPHGLTSLAPGNSHEFGGLAHWTSAILRCCKLDSAGQSLKQSGLHTFSPSESRGKKRPTGRLLPRSAIMLHHCLKQTVHRRHWLVIRSLGLSLFLRNVISAYKTFYSIYSNSFYSESAEVKERK